MLREIPWLLEAVRSFRRERDKIFGGYRSNFDIANDMPLYRPYGIRSPYLKGTLAIQAANDVMPMLVELIDNPQPVEFMRDLCPANAYTDKLAQLLVGYGSDKATGHDYHYLYAHLLKDRIDAELKLLEIGMGTPNVSIPSNMGRKGKPGASLRAFRDFLPYAMIYGADIDDSILFSEKRIMTFQVDQTDQLSMNALEMALPSLDFIIDDGLHCPNANLGTVILANDCLRPGGYLVIEDIRSEAVPVWQLVAKLLPWECVIMQTKQAIVFCAQRQ